MSTKTFCDRCKNEVEKAGETILGYGFADMEGKFKVSSHDDLCKGCENAYLDFMDGKAVEAIAAGE